MTAGLVVAKMLLSKKMRARLLSHADFTDVVADVGGLNSLPSNMFKTIGATGSPVDRVFKNQVHGIRVLTVVKLDGSSSIGMKIRRADAGTEIVLVVAESPAANAGAAIGDTIVSIDGTSVVGMPHAGVLTLLDATGGTFTLTAVG